MKAEGRRMNPPARVILSRRNCGGGRLEGAVEDGEGSRLRESPWSGEPEAGTYEIERDDVSRTRTDSEAVKKSSGPSQQILHRPPPLPPNYPPPRFRRFRMTRGREALSTQHSGLSTLLCYIAATN